MSALAIGFLVAAIALVLVVVVEHGSRAWRRHRTRRAIHVSRRELERAARKARTEEARRRIRLGLGEECKR